MKSLSRVELCATPWTAAYQAPPSMGFSRQEYWSGVPLHSPPLCAREVQRQERLLLWAESGEQGQSEACLSQTW